MKKLFILLSILAFTTPSYACGCEGNSKEFLFFLIFLIVPIVAILFSKKDKKIMFYVKGVGLLTIWIISTIIIALLLFNRHYEIFHNSLFIKYWANNLVILLLVSIWIFISVSKISKYSYYRNKQNHFKDNKNA